MATCSAMPAASHTAHVLVRAAHGSTAVGVLSVGSAFKNNASKDHGSHQCQGSEKSLSHFGKLLENVIDFARAEQFSPVLSFSQCKKVSSQLSVISCQWSVSQ